MIRYTNTLSKMTTLVRVFCCLLFADVALAGEALGVSPYPMAELPKEWEISPANTVLDHQTVPAQSEAESIIKDVATQTTQDAGEAYRWHYAIEDAKANKWEGLGAFAGVTALGVYSWDWGSQGFHFNNEGWFGKRTGSGGTDKLGHAFTSYALTNAFAERLQAKGRNPERAALSAGLMTTALMLYVEAFDGVSADHGFSYEDVTVNLLGTGLAYLRQTHPRFKSLVDYRMEYKPSGYKGFRPLSDYEGQKYLLVLKFSGMDALKNTPLKYFELQSGYYSRGFSKQAYADGKNRARYGFVGVGINLTELLFGKVEQDENRLKKVGRFASEHIQIPYTYARSTLD